MRMGSRAPCTGPHCKEYRTDGAGSAVSAITKGRDQGSGTRRQGQRDKGQATENGDQGSRFALLTAQDDPSGAKAHTFLFGLIGTTEVVP